MPPIDPVDEYAAARLEQNAKHYKNDPQLDRVLALFETDRAAFEALPAQLKSHAGVYVDLREHHRDAVAAGVIKDDGSSAA